MEKKLYTLLLALLGVITMQAQTTLEEYQLWVAGTQVTSQNCDDLSAIDGVSVAAGGYAAYDPDANTLKLKDATIVQTSYPSDLTFEATNALTSSVDGFTLEVAGTCKISSARYRTIAMNTGAKTITGSGSLELTNLDGSGLYFYNCPLHITGGVQLTIDASTRGITGSRPKAATSGGELTISGKNTVVRSKGGDGSMVLMDMVTEDGLAITSPEGAVFNSETLSVVDTEGNTVKDEWVVVGYAGIPIDEANFPDANFRAWLLGQDYGLDGVLTDEEIEGVTSIAVGKLGIASLQGIEFFTELTNLECWGNAITSLDLSQNTKLENLICEGNQLTSLELSENTELEWLVCSDNQLTSLDVSGCTKLTDLFCNDNHLTSLDVSGCTELTDLFCKDNHLTSLDLSKNTELEHLDCNNNQLTSLDLSANTGLQYIDCSANQIGEKAMEAFVASLPVYESHMVKAKARINVPTRAIDEGPASAPLYVIDEREGATEGNVMTTTQVAAAEEKGWIPYYYYGTDEEGEYSGTAPTGIRAVDGQAAAPSGTRRYNLNGQRVGTGYKGIVIENGSKHVVK